MSAYLARPSLLGLLLLVSLPAAFAAGRISGTVVDDANGDLLPGANVILQGTPLGSATDLTGQFTINNVPAGTYTLVATYLGYESDTLQVTVVDGQTLRVQFRLGFRTLQSAQGVEVTAQAAGQIAAINQQLASNTIANIVSADRIQELPDVNAAESIGRLPGVAIQRSGGEATKIAIRGLSPKYSTVTVNGVRVPSTGGDDRDVDLSLISSNMLDGIEVRKAITPDMDGDATAGSVDLRLRKAPEGLLTDVMVQGGYNQLQDYYGNYKVAGTVSNRFFESRLGVIATLNADRFDRSADKFNGSYRRQSNPETGAPEILFSSLNLREEVVERARIGASALLDYRIPQGTVLANAFFNRLTNDGVTRVNAMSVQNNRHFFDLFQTDNRTSIMTASLGAQQDFNRFRYDATISRTSARSKNPLDYTWNFTQEGNAFNFGDYAITPDTYPTDVLAFTIDDSSAVGLANTFYSKTEREENETAAQFNLTVPFRLGNHIAGYVKTGGKLRWLDRINDEERTGRNGMQYGSTGGQVNPFIRCIDERIPEGFNGFDIGTEAASANWLPIYVLGDGYTRSNFLDGEYPLGYTADPAMGRQIAQALVDCGYFQEQVNDSRGRDYSGEERYQAGYVMTELNLGRYLTFIPGVRYERDHSTYTGQRYREVVLNNQQAAPTDLDTLQVSRDFDFWLPMLHLQVAPTNWLKLRLARTRTLQRPGFLQYAPIARIDAQQQFAYAGNSQLKPSTSTNYDASLSVVGRKVGLFTVSAFSKEVEDHIIWTRFYSSKSRPVLPGLNVPDEWITNPNTGQPINPVIDTYINNPNPATYRGFEVEWQTNFWYLPSVLKGLIFTANYTRIFSETEYSGFYTERVCTNCPNPRPTFEVVTFDTSRVGRMIDQPAHVANLTLGYDLRGFSARLSYLYQANRVGSIDAQTPVLDTFTGAYSRFDLALRQKLSGRLNGLELYTNLNNLNNRADRSFQGSPTSGSPTYIEYYGFTMDVGARYRFSTGGGGARTHRVPPVPSLACHNHLPPWRIS